MSLPFDENTRIPKLERELFDGCLNLLNLSISSQTTILEIIFAIYLTLVVIISIGMKRVFYRSIYVDCTSDDVKIHIFLKQKIFM